MVVYMVEVLRRYSNRGDLVKSVQEVLRRTREGDQTDEPGVCPTERGARRLPVRERLGDGGSLELVASFRAGTPKSELAARYGISLSSVKRVLRTKAETLNEKNPRHEGRGPSR